MKSTQAFRLGILLSFIASVSTAFAHLSNGTGSNALLKFNHSRATIDGHVNASASAPGMQDDQVENFDTFSTLPGAVTAEADKNAVALFASFGGFAFAYAKGETDGQVAATGDYISIIAGFSGNTSTVTQLQEWVCDGGGDSSRSDKKDGDGPSGPDLESIIKATGLTSMEASYKVNSFQTITETKVTVTPIFSHDFTPLTPGAYAFTYSGSATWKLLGANGGVIASGEASFSNTVSDPTNFPPVPEITLPAGKYSVIATMNCQFEGSSISSCGNDLYDFDEGRLKTDLLVSFDFSLPDSK